LETAGILHFLILNSKNVELFTVPLVLAVMDNKMVGTRPVIQQRFCKAGRQQPITGRLRAGLAPQWVTAQNDKI
jgi:hypothetical protein